MKLNLISLLCCLAVSCGHALETVSFNDAYEGHQQLANFEVVLSDSFAAQLDVMLAAASDGMVVFSLAVRRYFYDLIFPDGKDKGHNKAVRPFKYPIHSLVDPSIMSQYPVVTTRPPNALNDFVREHPEFEWLVSYNNQLTFITSSGCFCVVRENNLLKGVIPSSSQALSSKCNDYLVEYNMRETSPLADTLIENFIRAPDWAGNRKSFALYVTLRELGKIESAVAMEREFAMADDCSVEERTAVEVYKNSEIPRFFGDGRRLVKVRNPTPPYDKLSNRWHGNAKQYHEMVDQLEKMSNTPELSQQASELRQLMGQLGQSTISYKGKLYKDCGRRWIISSYPIRHWPKFCLEAPVATTQGPPPAVTTTLS